jgi:hypothetical protein
MVGQDLSALNKTCDWIKLMTYPRVLGPAGLPFELRALSNWLRTRYNIDEMEATQIVNEASGLSFSDNALDSGSIAHEIQLGRAAGVSNLLAGIALVEVEGVHMPMMKQIQADLIACHDADADGLVLSWDLWHIHPQFLTTVHAMLKK